MRAFAFLKKAAVGAFFGALLLLSEDLFSVEVCKPNASPHDQFEDTFAINSCLAGKGRIELEVGANPGYLIGGEGLALDGNEDTVLTSNGFGYATLKAMANMTKPILVASGSDYTIEFMDFNGQVMTRDTNINAWTEDARPANLILTGIRPTFRWNRSREACCGSALGVYAAEARIYGNEIRDNGRPKDMWPRAPYQLSDGMTLLYCWGCLIQGNYIWDTTDFAIIVGVIPHTLIQDNWIFQRKVFAIGAINSGNMLTRIEINGVKMDGNNETARFVRNHVDCGKGLCGSGISAGSHAYKFGDPHEVDVKHAGSYIDNDVVGAQIGELYEGVTTVIRERNRVKDSTGSNTFFNACGLSADLVLGDVGFAIPKGAVKMILHPNLCKPW